MRGSKSVGCNENCPALVWLGDLCSKTGWSLRPPKHSNICIFLVWCGSCILPTFFSLSKAARDDARKQECKFLSRIKQPGRFHGVAVTWLMSACGCFPRHWSPSLTRKWSWEVGFCWGMVWLWTSAWCSLHHWAWGAEGKINFLRRKMEWNRTKCMRIWYFLMNPAC